MKKSILPLILLCFSVTSVFAQAKVEKVESSEIPEKLSIYKAPFIPDFPFKDQVLAELFIGIQNETSIENPLYIGKNLVFNISFDSIPKIIKGEKVYREIEIYSPNSNTLSINFSYIELSKSAKLFIINDEESYILGPITTEEVSRSKNFDPGFIPGEKIRVLLIEEQSETLFSKVDISRVGHVIFDFFGVNKFDTSKVEGFGCYGYGCSAACLQNIKCFTDMDLESKAVALITYTDPLDPYQNIGIHGTGYLINNGAQNKRPLFLAMIHGIGGYMVPDLKLIFHYRSPQCTPTTPGPTAFFVQGATQLGLDPSNDLRLLELTTNPGNSQLFTNNPVSYLGWSIIDEFIPNIYGIGHPRGDVQKYMVGGQATPIIEPGTSYGVWKYKFTSGFPETVNSGSPTLNHLKRVIGSLRSVQAVMTCENYSNYDAYSVRLSRSWSLLCQYLDPNNEGIVALNTITGTPGSKVFPIVNGPNQVCSNSTFTLHNAPIDLSINWNIVEGASLLSSQTSGNGKNAIVSVSNPFVSGQVKIRFTIAGLCTNKVIEKTFWVGRPQASGAISGGTYVYTNHYIPYSITPVTGAVSYNWQLPYGWTGGGNGLGNSIYVTVGPSSGNVMVTPVNECGQGPSSSLYVTVINCPTCREVQISPNPASEYLSINPLDNKFDNEENFNLKEYQIYDLNGKLLKSAKERFKVSPVTIEVSDLPKGLYLIHLVFEEGIVVKKVIIDR